jgi:two-component system chemotaxis response regulator CheB
MANVSRVVVIGASAGGLEPLVTIARDLTPNLDAALFVVLHSSPRSPGLLPEILGRSGGLPAAFASDHEAIRRSRIYVAPADRHMLLTPEGIRLSHGPKENGFRPAVDPLFRSAADSFEGNAIGVVLSGGLSDGAAGLRAIKQSGGFAIVQDPEEAPFQSMPASALEMGPVDYSLPAADIGRMIVDLVRNPRRPEVAPNDPETLGHSAEPQTPPSSFTCPECHGALWEVHGKSPQFRCRVGHSYSVSRLLEMQDDGVERALFAALRAMEESGSLSRRLGEDASLRNQAATARYFLQRASEKERHAEVLRQVLHGKIRSAGKRKAKAKAKRARGG